MESHQKVTEQSPQLRDKSRRFSPRHRRLLWCAAGLVVAGLIGTILGFKYYVAGPQLYKPGEQLADITHKLDRGASASDGLRKVDRALPTGAPETRFTDITNEAGLSVFRSFIGNRTAQLPEDVGSGLAWGDFDNDGYDDLFLVSAGGSLDLPANERAPSLLFRNKGDGTFQKVEAFPDLRIIGMGAAWGDYNNDGWLDLIVTGYNTLALFRNDKGLLVRDPRFPNLEGFWTGVAFGDYDRDGRSDIYVCGYVKYKLGNNQHASEQFGVEVPFTLNPSSFESEHNLLFHNEGDGAFTEVAQKLGVSDPEGRSLSALWHDFDNDGWLDLYVANDVSKNKLFLNKHGRFVDASSAAWVGEYRGSMGLAAGDFDRDGADDLFISHWIAQQYALYQSLLEAQRSAARQTKPNARAEEVQLHFTDVAERLGIGQTSAQSIGWGASFVDVDSDGWLDLLVANGSTLETKQKPAKLEPMSSFLFWNQKGEFFHDLAPWTPLTAPHVSRGLAVADFNNDGAMDLAIIDHSEGVRLLRNDTTQGNWLELSLQSIGGRTRKPIGFGDGASVVVTVGGVKLRRSVTSASYLSQDSRRVHFGLGNSSRADQVEVRWLDGRVDTYSQLEANAIWNLTEGDAVARRREVATKAAVATEMSKEQLIQFWEKHRAGMDALKRENDIKKAANLFREAVALNPYHEDSRYYLANCLYAMGDTAGALAQLDDLIRINPQTHRGYQRKGLLLAASANSTTQLNAAEESVSKAVSLNPEETGALMLLGEIALLRGDPNNATRRLELACRTHPRAVGAYFLRGYIAWKSKDVTRARELLEEAKKARGKEWKPKGSVAEGDVRAQMYTEGSVLASFWDTWDGSSNYAVVFGPLDKELKRRSSYTR